MYRRLSSLRRSSNVGDWRGLPQTGQSTVHRRRFTRRAPAQTRGKPMESLWILVEFVIAHFL